MREKIDIFHYEKLLINEGYKKIVGVDEVGRGPMAGPLVAAAVILPSDYQNDEINDSKKLTEKKREQLYNLILNQAVEVSVTFIYNEEVDNINVYQASKKAMIESIKKLKSPVDYILTDAMKLDIGIPELTLIKGDQKSVSIAAASIIAKVTRDNYMKEIDNTYPEYGFKDHKGYVTKKHLEALEKYGVCPIHRRTFEPVRKILYSQIKFDV